jgi:CRISPR-associated endonuclease/helicase Cas3
MNLTAEQFDEFFEAVHTAPDTPAEERVRPFPWQSMLAARVAAEGWPRGIDLPTASGKTACLDIAVYALALSAISTDRLQPRRVFFIVDRRIVVDEAYLRALKLARALKERRCGIIAEVADRLCDLAGARDPLVVSRMRGGIAREDAWVSNPAQPAIITSTVDQAGSRLLFRGYGPGELSQSIHGALVGCDSLILLDEAHCAVPFLQTARAVERYSGADWAEQPVARPFRFVVLSATLPPEIGPGERFPRGSEERKKALDHVELRRRITTPKRASLQVAQNAACASAGDALIDSAIAEARKMIAEGRRRIAVMVNRVAATTAIYDQLTSSSSSEAADVLLMTGRMRPYDRDTLVERCSPVLKLNPQREPDRSVVLVTTQCLEVGADFSFDGLVMECASLDALRQRFGRLNRGGDPNIGASATVLMRPELIKAEGGKEGIQKLEKDGEELDPVYGNALSRTWNWLTQNGRSEMDMSTAAIEQVLETNPPECGPPKLLAPSPDAPVLLPGHLDLLSQTAPRPEPDPDVTAFLHGVERGVPEASVVFRADLTWNPEWDEDRSGRAWLDTVSLVPPVSTEALRIPLPRLRAWLVGDAIMPDAASDIEGQRAPNEDSQNQAGRPFILWRGLKRSKASRNPAEVRPGDTVVVEADLHWAKKLGHYFNTPTAQSLDIAEAAYLRFGKRAILRVNELALRPWEAVPPVHQLLAWASDEARDDAQARGLLEAVRDYMPQGQDSALPDWAPEVAGRLLDRRQSFTAEAHPLGGVLLFERRQRKVVELDEFSDADDTGSYADECVPLDDHTRDVVGTVDRFTEPKRHVVGNSMRKDLLAAAWLHDAGKADERFQTLLLGRVPTLRDPPVAKSDGLPRSPSKRQRVKHLSGLPDEFRHEMVSVQLADACADLAQQSARRDLVLHLIASHHGYGRPFAPVCADEEPPEVCIELNGYKLGLSGEDRKRVTPIHRADSGVADRFWTLTRRYGWWGLAYLEAILRLADWHASQGCGAHSQDSMKPHSELPVPGPRDATEKQMPLLLPGLDGSNPLAYLAALGTLRGLARAWSEKCVRMSWTECEGAWRPQLHFVGLGASVTDSQVTSALEAVLRPAVGAGLSAFHKNLKMTPKEFGKYAGRRNQSQYAAGLATDAAKDRDGNVRRSFLQMVNGGKRQDYLPIMEEIARRCSQEHLHSTLFEQWRYVDPLQNLNLRWDPRDDRRHAYRWDDPSDPKTRRSGSQLGANRLAVEALPLFTVCGTGRRPQTVGFSSNGNCFEWPIWTYPVGVDVVRSLLTLWKPGEGLRSDNRVYLRQHGISAVFRSARFAVDKFQTASFGFAHAL